MENIRVGISVGDVNGIGLEVALKAFEDKRMLDNVTPIFFGSTKMISYNKKNSDLNVPVFGVNNANEAQAGKLNCVNIWKETVVINFGESDKDAAKYAQQSLMAAVDALKKGEIDVIVTAPINKELMQSDEFDFPGHTEYLESQDNGGKALMLMVSDDLKVAVATGHIAVEEIKNHLTREVLIEKIKTLNLSLKKDFAVDSPKIAIMGLDPHCGDNGAIGMTDQELTFPVVKEMFDQGYNVFGPYSADGFFGTKMYKDFDGVLAMYHDQGLVPFKTISFGTGVNYTAGLSFIRTSPDHGTAFEIAGKGVADETSFRNAVYLAVDLYRNRKEYMNLTENALEKNAIEGRE